MLMACTFTCTFIHSANAEASWVSETYRNMKAKFKTKKEKIIKETNRFKNQVADCVDFFKNRKANEANLIMQLQTFQIETAQLHASMLQKIANQEELQTATKEEFREKLSSIESKLNALETNLLALGNNVDELKSFKMVRNIFNDLKEAFAKAYQ